MGIFGWSLPPGCGTLPGEEEHPCEVCGKSDYSCVCPECPVCGEIGNPACYGTGKLRHLDLTREQAEAIVAAEEAAEQAYRDEVAAAEEYQKGRIVEEIDGLYCEKCGRSVSTWRQYCPACLREYEEANE